MKNNAGDGSDSEDEEENLNQQFKVILLGDGAVGKTSIATRFTENGFSQNYKQTVGVDFFIKRIILTEKVSATISMQMWDIGGQSIGSKMITNYISGADAILLCYDITNYESFANLEDWYRLVLKTFKDAKLPYVALLGNKNDLKHLTAVRMQQHQKFADENNMASFAMSAKNNDHVNQTFWKVASSISGIPYSSFESEFKGTAAPICVPAVIIDHQQHDPEVNGGQLPDYTKNNQKYCVIS